MAYDPFPRRVAVTGLGVVSPLGIGREAFWEALLECRTGFGPVRSFDTRGWRTGIGSEVPPGLPREASAYALAAAREALADAGAALSPAGRAKTGVALGTTSGESAFVEDRMRLRREGDREGFERAIAGRLPGSVPAAVARALGLAGPNLMLSTACAAGNSALSWAFEKIRWGAADLMLAGGVDVFSRLTYAGFSRLLSIARERCAPFSKGREGLIPAEGCAVLILEEWDRASARGARVYAEFLGYGASSDALHVTNPDRAGVARAISSCLDSSGIAPDEVDYISAHGTGTPANDRTESAAVRDIFGDRAAQVPISSIKSMLGHAMGAASALEAAATCLALHTGMLPPTANFSGGDPECPLDYVPNAPRRADPRLALSNAFAFGGSNCVIALSRPERNAAPAPSPAVRAVITGLAGVESDAPAALAESLLPRADLGFIDAPVAYALAACKLALDDAGLEAAKDGVRLGIVLDSTGEVESQYRFFSELERGGPAGVEPRQFPTLLANAAASRAAIAFGMKRFNVSLGGCFPGGEGALAVALDLLRRFPDPILLAGGVDRGAGMLVLETEPSARARGARSYAAVEVLQESFDPGALQKGARAGCRCLVAAVRSFCASGAARREVRGQGPFGGRIRVGLAKP